MCVCVCVCACSREKSQRQIAIIPPPPPLLRTDLRHWYGFTKQFNTPPLSLPIPQPPAPSLNLHFLNLNTLLCIFHQALWLSPRQPINFDGSCDKYWSYHIIDRKYSL